MGTHRYTLLVLGGTSAIALAYVRARLKELQDEGYTVNVCLWARNEGRVEAETKHLTALGADVSQVICDLRQHADTTALLQGLSSIDEAILAYGVLTDQGLAQTDDDYLMTQLDANFTSAVIWLERLMRLFEEQGHGRAIVIGSVAGDRGRQSNYAYGATKAGLATFVTGLQHRYATYPDIYLHLVKPGFVKSPMTDHLDADGLLWATPDQVAQIICKRSKAGKLISYTPGFWYFVMLIVRNVPAALLHKTKL